MNEYIERKVVINRIKEYTLDVYDIDLDDAKQFGGNSRIENYCEGLYEATELVDDIPAADVAPVVHGRWEFKDDDGAYPWTTKAICSECKKVIAWNARLSLKNNQIEFAHENHYCLNCGAIMDGGSD